MSRPISITRACCMPLALRGEASRSTRERSADASSNRSGRGRATKTALHSHETGAAAYNGGMKKERLGQSSLEVGPLALGGNVFGWTADEQRSFEVLDAFVAAGFNLIDTADVYSSWIKGHIGGESESMIGRWLERRGRRDDVVIATKVGMEMGPGDKGSRAPTSSRPSIARCSDCRPTTSTCTKRTKTTRTRRSRKRSAPSPN